MEQKSIKKEVCQFYNQIGCQQVSDAVFQNAQYECLRPVSWGNIHRCHRRVNRHGNKRGINFLDAGSGPIRYPINLTYSQDYQHRVCLDASIVALMEARAPEGVVHFGEPMPANLVKKGRIR